MTNPKSALAMAAFMIAFALAAVAAKYYGFIGGDVPLRATMAMIGLVMVFNANHAAKYATRHNARVERFAAWAGVLSGLAYTLAWIAAPMKIAAFVSMAPVMIAYGTVFAYCYMTRARRVS